MSADQPEVFAVVPLIPQVLPMAKQLYRNAVVEPKEVSEFALQTKPIHLQPLHDPSNPFIKTDKAGGETLFLLWGHPKNYLDPNYLVSMTCPLIKDSRGREMYKPSLLMRGPKANIIIVGGMSCCSALQTHWTFVSADGTTRIDDPRIPLAGMSSREHENWLQGKVHIASPERGLDALQHMALDMMAHHFPDIADYKHDCHDKPDYTEYAKGPGAVTLG